MSMNRSKILMFIGPTAVGKSSLLGRALKDYPQLIDIITYTTRAPRSGETEGDPYHFVTEERFKQLIEQKFFVEWALVHGKMYGTPRDQFQSAGDQGRAMVIDVDVQGAKTILREFPHAVTVFLKPPTMDALRQRFIKRGVTSEADLAKRLESAKVELAQAEDFGHIVINDDFDSAYAEIRKIVEKLLKNQ